MTKIVNPYYVKWYTTQEFELSVVNGLVSIDNLTLTYFEKHFGPDKGYGRQPNIIGHESTTFEFPGHIGEIYFGFIVNEYLSFKGPIIPISFSNLTGFFQEFQYHQAFEFVGVKGCIEKGEFLSGLSQKVLTQLYASTFLEMGETPINYTKSHANLLKMVYKGVKLKVKTFDESKDLISLKNKQIVSLQRVVMYPYGTSHSPSTPIGLTEYIVDTLGLSDLVTAYDEQFLNAYGLSSGNFLHVNGQVPFVFNANDLIISEDGGIKNG